MNNRRISISDKYERDYLLLDLIFLFFDFFFFLVLLFFSFAFCFLLSGFLNSLAHHYPRYPLLIILIPMIGVIILTFYYLKLKDPLENLKRLLIIDLILFLLYLTCIIFVYLTFIYPGSFPLYSLYNILLIPLISIILLTIYYLILNFPIESKRFSVVLIFLGLVITLFIVNYFLLDWSIPILQGYYESLPVS